jgi:mannan endo-1,6-alpha-mannosidase
VWKSAFKNFFNYWHCDGKVLLGCDDYSCNSYQYIAKGLFAADPAFVTMLAPYTAAEIIPRLQASAIAAARQCSGGDNYMICNIHWALAPWIHHIDKLGFLIDNP